MTKKLFAALVAAALVAACTDTLPTPTEPQETTSSVRPRFDEAPPPPDTTCRGMFGSGTRC